MPPCMSRRSPPTGREVRHTVICIIGNHLRLSDQDQPDEVPWAGHNFDFTDVAFDGGDLGASQFLDTTLTFTRAIITAGTLDFGSARFSGA
jgi:hypothetical protein